MDTVGLLAAGVVYVWEFAPEWRNRARGWRSWIFRLQKKFSAVAGAGAGWSCGTEAYKRREPPEFQYPRTGRR